MFKMNFLKSFALLLVLTPTAFAGAGGPTESEGAEGGAPRPVSPISLSTTTPPQGPCLDDNVPLLTINLSNRYLAKNFPESLALAFERAPNPVTLILSWNDIGPAGAEVLAMALIDKTQLQVLDLSGNFIGPDGAIALANSLKGNPNLRNLVLGGNLIGPAGAAALAEVLAKQKQLQVLDMSRNGIGPDGMMSLAPVLPMQGLRELDLSFNDAGPVGGEALTTALLIPSKTLRNLNLSRNKLGPAGTARLADALAGQTGLEELDLSNNGAGPVGGAALAEALLISSKNLRNLKLAINNLGPAGTARLADALVGQTGLEELDFSCNCNEVGQSGITALARVLSANIGLRKLCLMGNLMGPEGAKAFAPHLGKLKALSELDLGHNRLGADGITLIAKKVLPSLTKLEKLNLSNNYSGTRGEQAINRVLPLLPNLKGFRLEGNDPEEKRILDEIALQS